MKVNIKFYCREVVGQAYSGEYEVEAGIDIAHLMEYAANKNGTFCDGYLEHMIFLLNSKPAKLDSVLNDGDTVTVLRKAYGG